MFAARARHNTRMAKVLKWVVFLALGSMVLLAVVIFALHRWVSTEGFAERVEKEATAVLGVRVALDHVAVDVWPLPAVAVSGISVKSKPPITVERVEVRPQWQALLQGRLVVSTLLVRRAVLPQQGIDGVLLLLQKKKPAAGAVPKPATAAASQAAPPDWLPRRTVLDEVTWVSAAGARTMVQADARLGDDGLPDSVALKLLKGNLQGLEASLKREEPKSATGSAPAGDEWALRIDVGGGKVEGTLGLKKVPSAVASRPGEELQLHGKLQTRDVEVSALTAPSKSLTGKLEASTTLNSRAAATGALVDALQSQTTFTVRNAVLNGLDLAKAVQTVGLSRGGQTALDTLAGQVHTQGKAAQLTNMVASSGALSATGNVAISPAKALSGRVSVNVAGDSKLCNAIGGAVGVPLTVGGTLDNPEVTLSRSALLGAAIGTALLPGVGTGAGANLGDRVGDSFRNLFGK
jgi:hypothetical protein